MARFGEVNSSGSNFDKAIFEGRKYFGCFGGYRNEFADSYLWEGFGCIEDKINWREYKFNFEVYQKKRSQKSNNYISLIDALFNFSDATEVSPYNLFITPKIREDITDIILKKAIEICEKRRDILDAVNIEGLTLSDLVNQHIFGGFRTCANGHLYILIDGKFRI